MGVTNVVISSVISILKVAESTEPLWQSHFSCLCFECNHANDGRFHCAYDCVTVVLWCPAVISECWSLGCVLVGKLLPFFLPGHLHLEFGICRCMFCYWSFCSKKLSVATIVVHWKWLWMNMKEPLNQKNVNGILSFMLMQWLQTWDASISDACEMLAWDARHHFKG